MIFQAYGLFPWRTVLDNVLFGLRAKGLPTAEAREKARRALDLVGLRQSAGKHPHELSGGDATTGGHRPGPGGGAKRAVHG